MIKQKIDDDQELCGYSDKIMEEIERIDALLINLLSVSEHSVGETAAINLSVVIHDVLTDFSRQLNLQNVELQLNVAERSPVVTGNPEDIEQVFSNLIANALQEMSDGGELDIQLSHDEKCVYVQIADSGGGIPEENLSKIFDPFFTTKPKGTGFGLSAVLRIVKNCNGRVVAGNRPEGGAVFRLEFPVKESQ